MAIPAKEEKELWLSFANDAAQMYSRPDDLDDDEAVEHATDFTAGYADAMLDAYDARYAETKSRSRRKARKNEEDEE